MSLGIANLKYSKWKTLPYQILLKKRTQNHYRLTLEYAPNILHQSKSPRKWRKPLKSTLETKLCPGISALERIYVVPAASKKQVCHNLKRSREEESKIIGDTGSKKGIFCSRLDLDFQSINEKSNYLEVIKSTWS